MTTFFVYLEFDVSPDNVFLWHRPESVLQVVSPLDDERLGVVKKTEMVARGKPYGSI